MHIIASAFCKLALTFYSFRCHSVDYNNKTVMRSNGYVTNYVTQNRPTSNIMHCAVKAKVWVLAIALLTWVDSNSSALQSRKWQLIGMSWWYRGALCGHPLPMIANNRTCGAAPPPQSATLCLHRVARKLISGAAEGRRLSWPEHTVG